MSSCGHFGSGLVDNTFIIFTSQSGTFIARAVGIRLTMSLEQSEALQEQKKYVERHVGNKENDSKVPLEYGANLSPGGAPQRFW